jgi:hypothetical protein
MPTLQAMGERANAELIVAAAIVLSTAQRGTH